MKRADAAAIALILLSMLRIASTWRTFSATVDEPMHISAALELYTQHVYAYQPENPPLPRVVLGLAPYVGGMDFDPSRDKVQQLLSVFHSDGRYARNLVLARCGNLLFFAIAAMATWLWARGALGNNGGFVATLLFTMQPIIVGHSGVATHDAAATAGVALSLFAFWRWLDVVTPVILSGRWAGAKDPLPTERVSCINRGSFATHPPPASNDTRGKSAPHPNPLPTAMKPPRGEGTRRRKAPRENRTSRPFSPPQRGEGARRADEGSPLWQNVALSSPHQWRERHSHAQDDRRGPALPAASGELSGPVDHPHRSIASASAAGAAFGFAVLCKFSCIGYVPAAWAAMFIVRWMSERRRKDVDRREKEGTGGGLPPTANRQPPTKRLQDARALLASIVAAMAATILVIGLGYAFHYETLLRGIRGLAEIGRAGTHFGYLFGELSTEGWWYYFPVAIALKSTLASLILALSAIIFVRRKPIAGEALAAAAAILLVAMQSSLDLGVRYVLPLLVPLSVAGAAAVISFRRRWIGVALLAWHTGASLLAHPDAFPYFNEAAGRQPWRILADSNIDWGQDVLRLRRVIAEEKIDRIGLAVYGWHQWDELGFPPHYEAYPTLPTQGWLAVSEHLFQIKRFDWLQGRPYRRVGQSIRLYYMP